MMLARKLQTATAAARRQPTMRGPVQHRAAPAAPAQALQQRLGNRGTLAVARSLADLHVGLGSSATTSQEGSKDVFRKKAPKKIVEAKIDVALVPVAILPDRAGSAKEIPKGRHAVTQLKLDYEMHYDVDRSKIITAVSLTWKPTIQTIYKSGVKSSDKSDYGRGTTAADKLAGDISIGFHEGCHRSDIQAFIKTKPFPELILKKNATKKDLRAAFAVLDQKINRYINNVTAESEKQTDCVGIKAPSC